MLRNLNQNPVSVLLSRDQAAKYLGVSVSTLANWASTRRFNLPYVRVGRSVKYRLSDLDAFILSGEVD